MKDQLPFQARWTVRVLKWLLSREISLEEMLQDEDVLSGIVTYLTKKVAVEEEIPGQKEQAEKVESLEKELDFVRCRLQGADQQRRNEVQELEKRNAELREEVVKLTHKLKASEKEVFEAKFASGNVKAAMKKVEEELRDMRKKVEAQEQELARRTEEVAQAAARQQEVEAELQRLRVQLEEARQEQAARQNLSSQWEDERARLLFMLEERDNALSEAREGQAAATREIENLSSQLEALNARLALLESEAVQKGVPVVKVGMEPVVGEKAARMMAERKSKPSDDTPVPRPAAKRKPPVSDFDPISAVVGFSHKNMLELSDDARYVEKVNLDVESIPEPDVQPQKRPARSRSRATAQKAVKTQEKAAMKTVEEKNAPEAEKKLEPKPVRRTEGEPAKKPAVREREAKEPVAEKPALSANPPSPGAPSEEKPAASPAARTEKKGSRRRRPHRKPTNSGKAEK